MVEFSSPFDPIELSDPALESNYLRNLTFHSKALQGRGDVTLYIPPQCADLIGVPIVLLLHGVYGSHWAWFFKGAAHRTAQRLIDSNSIRPMLIAAPSDGLHGDGTGYLPYPHANYERWIAHDVPECIRHLFPCVTSGPILLSGLSMGGYGALRLGFKYPERFHAISAHSSITHISQFDQFVRHSMRPDQIAPEEPDVLLWAARNAPSLPHLRFDCGRDDTLFAANIQFHEDLESLQIPHTFTQFEGAHTWDYWQTHLTDTLLFFEAVMRRERSL
jgi:putative tributyrin esterase